MTKLTFDIDFNKDPEEILREIQERAKEEVAKRESKEKTKIYLSNLHKRVNEDLGTKYASINDLIRALSSYANPKSRSKTQATSPSGRRITISMNKEIFDEIKDLLAQPNPNKAAIARQTGVSVVQVRKVATGGYDKKFEGESSLDKSSISPAPKPTSDSVSLQEKPASPSLDLPPVSSPPEVKEHTAESPVQPLSGPDIAKPEPVDLPEIQNPPAPLNQEEDAPGSLDLPPITDSAPPAPSLDLPPLPEAPASAPEPPQPEPVLDPPTPPTPSPELPPAPPSPSLDAVPPSPPSPPEASPSAPTPAPGTPPKPSLSMVKKPLGAGSKPGGTKFSLKSGKKKTTGLKITRPPMKPPSA